MTLTLLGIGKRGGAVTARSSPTVRRRRLGNELRRLRLSAGVTIDQVAKHLECSESKISRIETGQVTALPRDVSDMLKLYEVGGDQQDELMQLAREARKKGWWHAYGGVPPRSAYIGFEAAAERISTYEPMVVPGLLQTPAYARTVIRTTYPNLSAEDIEQRIRVLGVRQALLKQEDPLTVQAVLDEAVLRRPIGGPETMRAQLLRLAEAAELPTVTIQVMPLRVGEHMGLCGAFTILSFWEPTQPNVVYLEDTTRESFLEAEEETRQYELAFEQLCGAALRPDASYRLFGALSKEL
jgi:transcriptional regulator with XRE-family HTH domain